MNLHAIAGPIVAVVNPTVMGDLLVSMGSTTDDTGFRTPAYTTTSNVPMQVQALSGPELALTEGLNIQGVKRAVYLYGNVEGINRVDAKGGDLLKFGGKTWLVVAVLETWDGPGWCKVAVTEQMP